MPAEVLQMKKTVVLFSSLLIIVSTLVAQPMSEVQSKREVKVLILPKFEVGEMSGDFPGEAQYYFDAYVKNGEVYDIDGGFQGNKLYVKDGVALYVTGMGKVNTAVSLQPVLSEIDSISQIAT
jgi:purine nucleoside permease